MDQAGCNGIPNRKRRVALILVALMVLIGGAAFIALAPHSSSSDGGIGNSHFPWIVLLPIYTSLIPIYIGAARRRRKKNENNG